MKFWHHDLKICLDDEWLALAGASEFKPSSTAYPVDNNVLMNGKKVCIIAIDEIAPVVRKPGMDLFNADPHGNLSAAERTIKILKGIITGIPLPPIELSRSSIAKYQFEVRDGTHRLYASLALGYRFIPAVHFLDLKEVDAGLSQPDLC